MKRIWVYDLMFGAQVFFLNKPTAEKLQEVLSCGETEAEMILSGGWGLYEIDAYA